MKKKDLKRLKYENSGEEAFKAQRKVLEKENAVAFKASGRNHL